MCINFGWGKKKEKKIDFIFYYDFVFIYSLYTNIMTEFSELEFGLGIYFCFIDYAKAFDCVDHNKLENSERDGNTRPPDLPLEKPVCRSGSNS